MTAPRPVHVPDRPPALHDRAMENLKFIREKMERASSFTAVSGYGEIVIALTAFLAAFVAARQRTAEAWMAVWFVEASLSLVIAGAAMIHKARRAGIPLLTGAGRKFLLSFAPAIVVGALLTAALYRGGLVAAMPGAWLTMYGTAVVAGGAFSVRSVIVMGLSFLLLGSVALFAPFEWADAFMAAGFGGLHLVFGIDIARRHGG